MPTSTFFAYGVILADDEVVPKTDVKDDLSFASFKYFNKVPFFGYALKIVGDPDFDALTNISHPQKWADRMKYAKEQFDKTSLSERAKFYVFTAREKDCDV